MVSANDTIATARPPSSTGTMSLRVTDGKTRPGRPWGSAPSTGTPARAARSKTPTIRVAPATAMSTPGRRSQRLSARITASTQMPIANAVQLVLPARTAPANARDPPHRPAASTEKPNSAGS